MIYQGRVLATTICAQVASFSNTTRVKPVFVWNRKGGFGPALVTMMVISLVAKCMRLVSLDETVLSGMDRKRRVHTIWREPFFFLLSLASLLSRAISTTQLPTNCWQNWQARRVANGW